MLINLQEHVAEFASVLSRPAPEEKKSFIEKIIPSSKISPQLAIDIYKNNTRGSRVNALKVVYPACKNILGENIFHSIAKEFVDNDMTGASDLNKYGATFDQHLHSIIKEKRLPSRYDYLPDLAQLEFLVHAAYYADDDLAFDFELFENRMHDQQQIYFQLSDSLGLLDFQVPIHEIWISNCKDIKPEKNSVQAITETQYLLIHRKENTPNVFAVNEHEYKLLYAFLNNNSLQTVIDSIECNIDVILPKLIANRWITGIRQ